MIAILCLALASTDYALGREVVDAQEALPDEAKASTDLLAMLSEATAVATQTRMNADYVPGIVTILHQEDMLALGLRSVAEALTLIPGVAVDRRNTGRFTISVRGLENDNTNVKVLLDSAPLSNDGVANFLEFPLAQVERIEVIRGPGSALYGESAFAALINIITLERSQVHLRSSTDGTTQLGAVYRFEHPERDLSLQLNLVSTESRGADLWVSNDVFSSAGLTDISAAPGLLENGERYRLGQLRVEFADAWVVARYQRNDKEAFFGQSGVLPDPGPDTDGYDVETWSVEGGVGFAPSANLSGAVSLRWNRREYFLSERIRAPGAPAVPPELMEGLPTGSSPLPDGLNLERYNSTESTEAQTYLEWRGWSRHVWRLELSLSKELILDAWRAYNADIYTFRQLPEMVRYTGDLAQLDPDASRIIRSVALQDQWSIHPDVDLTLNLRYDSYSDINDSLSARLAGVWRINHRHLIKAQFASAFFPPTLYQTYNNPIPVPAVEPDQPEEPQRIHTLEFGYIFRTPDRVARATLHYSKVFDVMINSSGSVLRYGEQRLQGCELEWEQRLSRTLKLAANLSYVDTLDRESNGPIPGTAKWLGNLSLLYRPRNDVLLAGRWRHVGDRARSASDSRSEPLGQYNDLSLTLSWFDVGAKGLTLRAGATNLLNDSIASPAPASTFEDDYPLSESRMLWAQLSYSFH